MAITSTAVCNKETVDKRKRLLRSYALKIHSDQNMLSKHNKTVDFFFSVEEHTARMS